MPMVVFSDSDSVTVSVIVTVLPCKPCKPWGERMETWCLTNMENPRLSYSVFWYLQARSVVRLLRLFIVHVQRTTELVN
jgi:hypothetical protein